MLKKVKKFIPPVILILVILAGFLFYRLRQQPVGPFSTEKIKIGFMAPLSGENSGGGFGSLKGVEMAKKDLGARNIEIITEDSGCDQEKSPAAIQRLIDQGVVAVIGEACSGASLAALPIANENKVVLISMASTSPKLSIADDYFFRTVPPDNLQGQYAAELMYENNFRKLAILYSNEDYGIAFYKEVKNSFTKLGGEVVAEVPFAWNSANFTSQMAKIKNSNPDVVYLISNSGSSSTAALKAFQAANIQAALYAGESVNDNVVLNDAADAAEGLIITAVSMGSKSFRQSYKAEFNMDAGIYSPQAYDAFHTLYLAFQKGAKTGEDIKNILPSIEFEGKSGPIKFDQNGEVAGNYEPLIVRNRKSVSLNE